MKKNMNRVLTFGAAIAASAALVSCDDDGGDTVVVAPTTDVQPNQTDVVVPDAAALTGQSFSQFAYAQAAQNGLPLFFGFVPSGLNTFVDGDTFDPGAVGGALFDFTRTESPNGFTLSAVQPQVGGYPAPVTQAFVNATILPNPALGTFVFADIQANKTGLVHTATANKATLLGVPHAAAPFGATATELNLERISQNNKVKSDAVALNGNLPLTVIPTVSVTDPSGNVLPLGAFNGPTVVGALIAAPFAGTDFDPTVPTFVGFTAIANLIARPDVSNTLELDVTNTQTYLTNLISQIDAADAGLQAAVAASLPGAGFTTVSDHNITFVIDEQIGTDVTISRQGTFTTSTTGNVPSVVTLTAATNGYRVGDTYIDATTSQTVNSTNSGVFTLQQVNP